jgi:putative acetyltransferase
MNIRIVAHDEADAVRSVYLAAFPETERDLVAALAVALLSEKASPPILSLVAEVDDTIVGHVAFSPVTTRDTREDIGYILAPLAVTPVCQNRGIASHLIRDGIGRLSKSGAEVLLVYGDPRFYGRFGFGTHHAQKYLPPHELQYAFGWQGMALREGNERSTAVGLSCVSSLDNPALW